MHPVYLGLGSNIDPAHYIHSGVTALRQLFGCVAVSSVYRSAAVGFEGAPFLNLVARIETGLRLRELVVALRNMEYTYGRRPGSTKFSSRHLDIDILTFNNYCGVYDGVILPRPEVVKNAYVLCPFAELAPDLVLPTQSATLRELWLRYPESRQRVTNIGAVSSLSGSFDDQASSCVTGGDNDYRRKEIHIFTPKPNLVS